MRAFSTGVLFVLVGLPVHAAEYYNQKWFDYPDIGTAPRLTTGCAHEACTDVPEVYGFPPQVRMNRQCICTNSTVRTEVLRRDVRVVGLNDSAKAG